jgi:hypothetical protein
MGRSSRKAMFDLPGRIGLGRNRTQFHRNISWFDPGASKVKLEFGGFCDEKRTERAVFLGFQTVVHVLGAFLTCRYFFLQGTDNYIAFLRGMDLNLP